MGSSRLPGKALADLAGLPLLAHVVRRARAVPSMDRLLLATTTDPADDLLVDFARSEGVDVRRGDTVDLASRVLAAVSDQTTHFVRLNGDSPFLDPDLIEEGMQLVATARFDFVTNLVPRTYPYGISVEIVDVAYYRRKMREVENLHLREHVTGALYEDAHARIAHLRAGEFANIRTVVDTPADLEDARAVARLLGNDLHSARYPQVAQAYIETRQERPTTA